MMPQWKRISIGQVCQFPPRISDQLVKGRIQASLVGVEINALVDMVLFYKEEEKPEQRAHL